MKIKIFKGINLFDLENEVNKWLSTSTIEVISMNQGVNADGYFVIISILYKNIDYYLSLVKQDDFERLASSLGISKEEAESIDKILKQINEELDQHID